MFFMYNIDEAPQWRAAGAATPVDCVGFRSFVTKSAIFRHGDEEYLPCLCLVLSGRVEKGVKVAARI